MKPISKAAFAVILSLFLISCGSNRTMLQNGKKIDAKLTGEWTGSEVNAQMEGMTKQWVMTRKNDGTFVLDFTFIQNGETHKNIETGTWWIEDGKFYENHEESGMTDVYTYQVLDKDHIKFKSVDISVDMNKESYEFIDTRKNSVKEDSSAKDGSSFEKAIKVKSVPDEYKYVKENCRDCQMKSQSLSENNKKYYDILTLTKSDGTEVKYYFDISSFYGKW